MIACPDLEGVLVPEIWINVAARTGIEALRRTTRDEPDYDKLMRGRLAILAERGLGLADIQSAADRRNLYINRAITGALVGRQPFGGFRMSGIGSKAGGPDYLYQFVIPRTITENTLRRGFAPTVDA